MNAFSLFDSWKRIQQTVSSPKNQELLWTADELNSTLEAIEQDIEDLQEALQAAQHNPSQFNLSVKEMNARKKFLDNSRNSIQTIRKTLANPPNKKIQGGNNASSSYQTARQNENSLMIENEQQQQMVIPVYFFKKKKSSYVFTNQ